MRMGLDEERGSVDVIDRWFRELDQRRIYYGAREWLVEVTGILCDADVLWIQIAGGSMRAGSVLLRVRATASVEHAVRALSRRALRSFAYPDVINAVRREPAV